MVENVCMTPASHIISHVDETRAFVFLCIHYIDFVLAYLCEANAKIARTITWVNAKAGDIIDNMVLLARWVITMFIIKDWLLTKFYSLIDKGLT